LTLIIPGSPRSMIWAVTSAAHFMQTACHEALDRYFNHRRGAGG
jgi:hypothetical protein